MENGVRRYTRMGFYQNHIVPHLVNLAMRNRLLGPYRERIVGLAEGRVLEIGLGSGMNLTFYTNRVTGLLGLELHPKLLDIGITNTSNGSSEADQGAGGIDS